MDLAPAPSREAPLCALLDEMGLSRSTRGYEYLLTAAALFRTGCPVGPTLLARTAAVHRQRYCSVVHALKCAKKHLAASPAGQRIAQSCGAELFPFLRGLFLAAPAISPA